MDDEMEDQLMYEVFATHAHLIWRYMGVTTAGLVELIMPGPGESFKTKILQPGPFMFFMFLVIVASVVLQSGSHRISQWLLRAHCFTTLADPRGFKTLGGIDLVSASIGSDNISWEFKDKIVGVYGMQGRRGNMEDRYSIIQDVDVGEKKMSFFGVFDGHGGQYTAEYVKEHLFKNTIEKIKQLRSQVPSSKKEEKGKNGNNNSISTPYRKTSSANGKKVENQSLGTCDSKTTTKETSDTGSAVEEGECELHLKKSGKENCNIETSCPDSSKSDDTNSDTSSECPIAGCGVETLSQCSANDSILDSDTSMKKDDNYSSVNIKKRNSLNSNSPTNGNKEKKEENTNFDQSYIDSYKNINYTRLLTDQIIAVDNQVVEQCKSRTDMSGTTAVIAVLDGELLIIGNVGDSRAVMGDLKGSTIPLSFDHKPNQLKERRRIKEAGGFITFTGVWRVAGILATSRALGDFPLKEPRKLVTAEPDVLTFSLRDHKAHFVILATDGLWDVLTNEEAVAYIRDHIHESDFGAKSLSLHAYYKGSQDNITILILNISELGL